MFRGRKNSTGTFSNELITRSVTSSPIRDLALTKTVVGARFQHAYADR